MENKNTLIFQSLGVLLVILFLIDILTGEIAVPVKEIFHILFSKSLVKTPWDIIIVDYRIPKALTAVLAGIGLSVSGLQMQTVFRNPLAGPYVLGINAGASLGVAVMILGAGVLFRGFHPVAGNLAVILSSWIGAFTTLLLILLLSFRVKDIMLMLILGILIGNVISAMVSVLQFYSHETVLKSYVVWSMGSVSNTDNSQMLIMAFVIGIGILLSVLTQKWLNGFLLGEEYAVTLGIRIHRARLFIFITTSLLAGTVTAFCGPIGFVGMVIPHIARILFKTADHRILIPGCMLVGAIFMLVCDMLTNLPGTSSVLPINTVTSVMGIPVIIWIIIKNKQILGL